MIKYERGLSHSYVVFTDDENKTDDLSLNMLRENDIEGLLSAKISVNNAVAEVAYEISGYKSMKSIFENIRIYNEQIMILLKTLSDLSDILGCYYLEPEYLVLDPENIYWNEDFTEVFFCYDPTTEKKNSEDIIKLSELILERADYSDYKSVVYAYEFHQAVKQGSFSLGAVIEKLQEVGESPSYERRIKPYIVADNKQAFYGNPTETDTDNEEEKEMFEKYEKPEVSGKKEEIIQEMAELLDSDPEDDWENEEPSGKLFGFSRKKKVKKEKSRKQECEDNSDLMEESFFHVGKVDSPGENRIFEVKKLVIHSVNSPAGSMTVENYPFLVGSLQYAVDGCIDSPDISRFHARLDQNMGKVYLSDLNSVSGTYLNGERLKGSVQKEIKAGDKISFGKQEYVIV